MSELNLKELEDLTGFAFKTLKKRLGDLSPARTTPFGTFFNTKEALPLLYTDKKSEDLDLTRERAKLANAQTEKTLIETERLKDRLVSVEEVEQKWVASVLNVRTKLLLLPKKMASELKGITEVRAIEDCLNECIFDALTELSKGPDA